MGRVRPLVEDDILQVADLHKRVFGGSDESSSQALRSYLIEIFCRHPWYNEALPSLVYQENNGRIIGCLGVMPRRMSMNGRPIQVAVTHNFMVEPDSRYTLAGVQLLKTFWSGPQDLSIAEGNHLSRKIWEGFGGTTSLLYSFRWMRPLRPSRCVLSFLRKRGLPAVVAFALRPFCHIMDAIAARIPQTPFRQLVPQVSGEDLNGETLLACLSDFSQGRSLRPEYDNRSVQWLLEILAQKKRRGTFRKVIVRNAQQEIVGWYLYYPNPRGISEVVQIGAKHSSIRGVLDHLFYDAWQHGVIAVTGQLDPGFMLALSDRCCFFDSNGFWMLVHSKHPDVLQAIHCGDAFLTRLEGEGWIRLAF